MADVKILTEEEEIREEVWRSLQELRINPEKVQLFTSKDYLYIVVPQRNIILQLKATKEGIKVRKVNEITEEVKRIISHQTHGD